MVRRLAAVLLVLSGCANEVIVLGTGPGEADFSCHDDAWLAGASCARVLEADDDASLASAVAEAKGGDCIDVAAGRYGGVSLPASVSLLGRGAGCVTLSGGVAVAATGESLVRGVRLESVGLDLADGQARVRVANVQVADSSMNGIRVGAGSSLELTGSHITRAARYGIAAFGANVAVSDSRIDHSGGPGLWVSCTMETFVCGCPERPQLRVERTELTDNHTVGLYAGEAIATLNEVAARRTQVGANFQYGQGMTFGPCTDLQADGLTVEDNADGGLLALDSSVEIRGLAARGNLRGVSVTGSQGVSIEDAELEDNVGQGVGVLEGSRLVLRGATIRHTTAKVLPVVINGVSAGQAEIGDGIDWCRGASVQLSDIALESNARLPLLIHGGVGPDSRLERITLLGSDEQTGLVWATNGGEPGPTIGDGVPPLEIVDPDSVAIPCGELVPP